MIIGSGFGKKEKLFLEQLALLSGKDTQKKIPVKKLNEAVGLDKTELKNRLEYLDDLGYLKIETIGGPWLYGHVSITQKGIDKASENG